MPSYFPTPDRSPTVQINITNLIDDVQCYQTVRELRWPDGIACPSCQSTQVIKRGFDDTAPARQRYECHGCDTRFDDLTDTIFAGHHQPLKVVDRKIKSPFARRMRVLRRLPPATTVRWRQWGKTERGALGRDGTRAEG